MNPSTAISLAAWTAESGMWPSATLEVTLTTTPEPRSRNWGGTARVFALTPKVVVSKTSRTRAGDVRVGDQDVAGAGRLGRGGDAVGAGHVERDDAEPVHRVSARPPRTRFS